MVWNFCCLYIQLIVIFPIKIIVVTHMFLNSDETSTAMDVTKFDYVIIVAFFEIRI